jgi:hypothetical protein
VEGATAMAGAIDAHVLLAALILTGERTRWRRCLVSLFDHVLQIMLNRSHAWSSRLFAHITLHMPALF